MKNMKKFVWIFIIVLAMLCGVMIFLEVNTKERALLKGQDANINSDEYTWEEYLALSLEEQDAFFDTFDSVESFEEWMEAVKPAEVTESELEWNKLDKNPDEYTWEEYQKLNSKEQESFYSWFDSKTDYETWVEANKPAEDTESELAWNKLGKKPNEYTWEEYLMLDYKEQDAFYSWFDSRTDFEAWIERVKPTKLVETTLKWNKLGKKPSEYTWEEYLALNYKEQDEFYSWFDSKADFEAWLEEVRPDETTESAPQWDKSGKGPSEYTWEEYQALNQKEQDAFYFWFDSKADFEAWMEKAKTAETTETMEKWDQFGKDPDEYTWEEYQALTPQGQDIFFQWFDSVEAFEKWMYAVNGIQE